MRSIAHAAGGWWDLARPPRPTRLTIHMAMRSIARAAGGWWDDGWSDIVGLTLAVNLGGGQPWEGSRYSQQQ
ncbi:MAG: hypothetical protein E6I80_10030 [Chloroflexi bacterium]|nr:MAG: hypothetical protein E6I80_10030 [Chloroflexota bacterium]